MVLLTTILTLLLAPVAGLFLASAGAPWIFFWHGDPLMVLGVLAGSYALASFVLAWITGDCSQTDRLWSLAPGVYSLVLWARDPGDPRMILMTVLVLAWCARLTFNFARREGYTKIEDYRWAELRKRIKNPWVWQVFNLTFIAGYQHALILAFVLPQAGVLGSPQSLGLWDGMAAGLFLGSLALETLADQQMWNFQRRKARALAAGSPLPEGNFITRGLWKYSRHPNVFFEALNWWIFFLFIFTAGQGQDWWTGAGAVLLTLLLQGSIQFTESLTLAKYPEFAQWQRRTSWFIPWFPGKGNP